MEDTKESQKEPQVQKTIPIDVREVVAEAELSLIKDSLRKEDVVEPNQAIEEWVDSQKGSGVIVYGEANHHGEGTLSHQVELAELLAENHKLRTIFLEEDEDQNGNLQAYFETGTMPEELRDCLTKGGVRADSQEHEYKLKLVEKAHEHGVEVVFIDDNELTDRDDDWHTKIKERIGDDIEGLHFLIAGRAHCHRSPIQTVKQRWIGQPAVKGPVRTPAAGLLEKDYPGKVLTINSVTEGVVGKEYGRHPIVDKRFKSDLEKLGIESPAAVWTADSPYKGRILEASNTVKADDYDLTVMLPGRNLSD